MLRHVTLPKGFFLGAASSAWQTEGWNGKKATQDSYMDLWYKNHKSAWHNGYGPAVATNFHDRYQEDIDLMKEINAAAVTLPVRIGDVVIADVLGTGADVVVTANIE